MVRSKGNIIVKDKSGTESDLIKTTKLYANKFPQQSEVEYK
jgi:hypothetical protein